MPSCVIKTCPSKWRRKDPHVVKHSFPNNRERVKRWLLQAPEHFPNVDEWVEKILKGKPTDQYRLCSLHFDYFCYKDDIGRKILRKDALPTIFPSLHKSQDEDGTENVQDPDIISVVVGGESPGSSSQATLDCGSHEYAQSHPYHGSATGPAEQDVQANNLLVHMQNIPPMFVALDPVSGNPKQSVLVDKSTNTDIYWNKDLHVFIVDTSMIPKRNVVTQTLKPKRKSRGTACKLIDMPSVKRHKYCSECKNIEKRMALGEDIPSSPEEDIIVEIEPSTDSD